MKRYVHRRGKRIEVETLNTGVLVPKKIAKRREHFIRVPFSWYERLAGANAQSYRVALYLLYAHWKAHGGSIKLTNGMLRIDGVPPTTKRRALRDLESRGLIAVERARHRSPSVTLILPQPTP